MHDDVYYVIQNDCRHVVSCALGVWADSNASVYTWQLELEPSGVPVRIEVTRLFRILRSDWLTRFSNMLTQQCQEILDPAKDSRPSFGRAHVRVWERETRLHVCFPRRAAIGEYGAAPRPAKRKSQRRTWGLPTRLVLWIMHARK